MLDSHITDLTHALPPGWGADLAAARDIGALTRLSRRHEEATRGCAVTDIDDVEAFVIGVPSWVRSQAVVRDPEGEVRLWVRVHDRARGRVVVDLVVDPEGGEELTAAAAALLAWADAVAVDLAEVRQIGGTQVDANVYDDDAGTQALLRAAGFEPARRWLHQSRPVTADEGVEAPLKPGVRVRPVSTHQGIPRARDLQVVHAIIERSFADHFNSFAESDAEFISRMSLVPGHDFALWFLAEAEIDGAWVPVGALVGSRLGHDADGLRGLYVEYVGVTDLARGRGAGKGLLLSAIGKAARRGWSRVDLEVDADSMTSADRLYEAMGWRTEYVTQSWHKTVTVPESRREIPQPSHELD